MSMQKYYIVVPNWNGADKIGACIDSLLKQSQKSKIIVVDNGSTDESVKLLEEKYPEVILIKNGRNFGFAGGVNTGIKYAMKLDAKYIALFNNDAIADKNWLKNLIRTLDSNKQTGVVTGKILSADGSLIDSTGDYYTIWGLPHPRGRDELSTNYQESGWIFGASGGASLYRTKMLEEIGLFDKNFFAYYEDVDLSFRAQLAGWKVRYEPSAIAYHHIGATSSKISGFTTYHTLKNLPFLFWKNVPWVLMPNILPRFTLAYLGIAGRSLLRGQFAPFFKGVSLSIIFWPKKMVQRYKIQKNRKVSTDYINSILVHDLPPNAHSLRSLRNRWWKLLRKGQNS